MGGFPPGVTGADCDLAELPYTERQFYDMVKSAKDWLRLNKADWIENAIDDSVDKDLRDDTRLRNGLRAELMAAFERGEI